jgi:endonuclease-3
MVKGEHDRALEVLRLLEDRHGRVRTRLRHSSPFELLVATILAAQCTDERVNKTTPALFAEYPDAPATAGADIARLEELVRPTGFFRQKAKNIRAAARELVERHGGDVPAAMEDLVRLPGVGRKTANVMLGHFFGRPAVIVDTHFRRVMRRMEFTTSTNPDRIEKDLRAIVPSSKQTRFSMVVNEHGRLTCRARKPDCPRCAVLHLCPYPQKTV